MWIRPCLSRHRLSGEEMSSLLIYYGMKKSYSEPPRYKGAEKISYGQLMIRCHGCCWLLHMSSIRAWVGPWEAGVQSSPHVGNHGTKCFVAEHCQGGPSNQHIDDQYTDGLHQ